MKRFSRMLAALLVFASLCSHDMFLKMDTYILDSGRPALISIFNGSFDMSENVIDRERMVDASMVGLGKRSKVDTSLWREKDSATLLSFTSGEAGTWIAGVSLKPRSIEMKAADFNEYLVHDGLPDMLEWRKKNNALQQDAIEEYSKHAKVIFQVGTKITEDYKTNLGYPLEFIPLQNPYDLHAGHSLKVQLLWQGKPLANEWVYVGFAQSNAVQHTHANENAHTHADGHTHTHVHADSAGHHQHHNTGGLRTNASGMVEIPLDKEGIYYLKTIYLTPSQKPGFTHESTRATLSFEVGQGHSHNHAHSHTDEGGLPTYIYLLASIALVGLLFWWFNRKRQ